jgi:hypothetical protein
VQTNSSMPIQAYACSNRSGIQPKMKLLGWFADGACASLRDSRYIPDFCPVGVEGTPMPAEHLVRVTVAVPMTAEEFTPAVQLRFREGLALAAEVDVSQVVIIAVVKQDGSFIPPARRLLSSSLRVQFEMIGLSLSAAEQVSVKLTPERINNGLAVMGLPAVTITIPPSIIDGGAVNPDTTILEAELATSSASGVGGVWRDTYGDAVTADGPIGWWRFNYLDADPHGGRMRQSPCISCAGESPGGPAAHRGGTRDGGPSRCRLEESFCAANVDQSVLQSPEFGIPNSESLWRSTGNARVAPEEIITETSPASGEGISAATGGKSGQGSGFRLSGQGGISIPYTSRLLHHTSFTFEMWLRLGQVVKRGGREQSIASCGWVVSCGQVDRNCRHSMQVWCLLFVLIRLESFIFSCFICSTFFSPYTC